MRKRDRNFEVYRKSIQEQNVYKQPTAFVIFGASVSIKLINNQSIIYFNTKGDLAKKEIYPNLFWLFKDSLLPQNTAIVGFGRKNLEIKDYLKQKIVDRMKLEKDDQEIYDIFVDKNHYICGNYNDEQKFKELDSTIQKLFLDSNQNLQSANRIFYLAVPPKVYPDISQRIAENCRAKE